MNEDFDPRKILRHHTFLLIYLATVLTVLFILLITGNSL